MMIQGGVFALILSWLIGGLIISPAAAQTNILDIEEMAVFQADNGLQVAVSETGSASIEIYDGSGNFIKRLEPNFSPSDVRTLDWNADGTRLAVIYVGSKRLNIAVWDVAASTIIAEQNIDFARYVSWHPVNPDVLMIILGTTIMMWDLSSDSSLTTYDPNWMDIEYAIWSPSGKWIALEGGAGYIQIVNVQTLKVIFEVAEHVPIPERTNWYFSFDFSPSEDRVALYDLMNAEIEIWNLVTQQMELAFDSFDTSSQHHEILRWLKGGLVGMDFQLDRVVFYNANDGTFKPIIQGKKYWSYYFPPSGDRILFVPFEIVANAPFFVEVELPNHDT